MRYEGSKVCLDFALRTKNYEPVFRFLASVFGPDARVSVHKGKYQVPTAPLRPLCSPTYRISSWLSAWPR